MSGPSAAPGFSLNTTAFGGVISYVGATGQNPARTTESAESDRKEEQVNVTRTRAIVALAIAGIVFPATGCVCIGERVELVDLRTEDRVVELGGAESVEVEVDLGVGELSISTGSGPLLDGTFVYNVAEWEPIVEYSVDGSEGVLTIKQTSSGHKNVGKGARCEWDLVLSEGVPLTLVIDMGVGEARLDLGALQLTDLSVDHGVGELYVDLSGDHKDDYHADIDGGVGEIELTVPSSIGVRIDADTGIGSLSTHGLSKVHGAYVNEAYGETDVTLNISIDAGVGSISINTDKGRETGI